MIRSLFALLLWVFFSSHTLAELSIQQRFSEASLIAQKEPNQAYRTLRAIHKELPFYEWKKEDAIAFRALEITLNDYYDDLFRQAKRYTLAKEYKMALKLYEEIASAIQQQSYPRALLEPSFLEKKVHLRQAECHFAEASYEKSLTSLKGLDKTSIDREMLHLSTLCYKLKKEYVEALELFPRRTKSLERSKLNHYDEALFEMGYGYFITNAFAKAREVFAKIPRSQNKTSMRAALYLAKIALKENRPREVESYLSSLCHALPLHDPLKAETFYLLGLAASALGDPKTVIEHLETALCLSTLSTPWKSHASSQLAAAYMHLALSQKTLENRGFFLEKSEKIFEDLLTNTDTSIALLLARVYLLQNKENRADSLLKKYAPQFTSEQLHRSLLFQAEACSEPHEKERFLLESVSSTYASLAAFWEGWYAWGLHQLQKGTIKEAIKALETALVHPLDPQNLDIQPRILNLDIYATNNALLVSLDELERLSQDASSHNIAEIFYLKGLILSSLPNHLTDTIDSLLQVIEINPTSTYADRALYMLSTLHYREGQYRKAKELFLELVKTYPHSIHRLEGFFGAALTMEKLGEDPSTYYRRVFEDYPHSILSPHAYFRYYTLTQYFKGVTQALIHLKEFPEKFPNSPLRVAVFALLAQHQTNYVSKKEHYEKALLAFSECRNKEPATFYFRYESQIKLAQLFLAEKNAKMEVMLSIERLKGLVADFSKEEDPWTCALKVECAYPPLFQEGEFTLMRCYLYTQQFALAEHTLYSMLAHFQQAGIEEGRVLSDVWQQMGTLAFLSQDSDTAARCFEIAKDCLLKSN